MKHKMCYTRYAYLTHIVQSQLSRDHFLGYTVFRALDYWRCNNSLLTEFLCVKLLHDWENCICLPTVGSKII